MNHFLPLELHDEESKGPLRVSINPRFIVSIMAYTTDETYVQTNDTSSRPIRAVSVTIEMHNGNVIDMLVPEGQAETLMFAFEDFESCDWQPGEQFWDMRNYIPEE